MFTASRIRNLLRDERGGYTVWALTWFMIYLAIGGLAVDATNAYRNQALLQSTADSAALAAVMSLPDQVDSIIEALAVAGDNMDAGYNGAVLKADDITFGSWDYGTKTFTPGAGTPNAVHVVTRRAEANANPVGMSMLHILALFGLDPQWDISAEAVAVGFVPSCLNDGFVAQGRVFYRSNNSWYGEICIHGQDDGVAMRGGNHYDPDVRVSMGDLGGLDAPGSAYDDVKDNLVHGDAYPKDVANTFVIIDALRDLPNEYNEIWGFMYRDDGAGGRIMPAYETSAPSGNNPWEPYTVYDINCTGTLKLSKKEVLENVVIIASCRIHASSDLSSGNVVLASSYVGGAASIHLAAKSGLGYADDCAPGGGAEIYTPGDIHMAAKGEWHGVRMISGGDIKFTANNIGIWGISVQAAGDIDLTSNNEFGLCSGGVPGPVSRQYRLVR